MGSKFLPRRAGNITIKIYTKMKINVCRRNTAAVIKPRKVRGGNVFSVLAIATLMSLRLPDGTLIVKLF